MKNEEKKCSLKEHEDINAIYYCQECKIFMCNKCENIHSKLLQFHNLYKLDKDINEMFTEYCKEENHKDILEFFCKTHNQLCCSACITKIKKKGKGQHTDCSICVIEDIKDEKKNKLKENINILKDLINGLDDSINIMKEIFEKINKHKDELKINIQKKFTKIRNALNDREDELLLEIDKYYDSIFINENIINDKDKFQDKIKTSLEKGIILDKDWNENRLISTVNDCINIENKIKEINLINENIKKCKNLNNININFSIEEKNDINKLLDNIKKFGIIKSDNFLNDSLILFKDNIFCENIRKTINSNKEISTKLLYRQSRDGDSIKTFHNLCDKQGPTLVLFETSDGYKFGGYTPLDWDDCSSWKTDDNTFLFSLSNKIIYKKKKKKSSILCSKDYGPWFAHLGSEFKMSQGKYYIRKDKKELPFEDYSSIIPNEDNDKNFIIKELEVYKIV